MTKKPKKLTNEDLGLVPEVRLSEMFDNRHEAYKIVNPRVMGYQVISPTQIVELHHATIFVKRGRVTHVFDSYERGRSLVRAAEGSTLNDRVSQGISRVLMAGLLTLTERCDELTPEPKPAKPAKRSPQRRSR